MTAPYHGCPHSAQSWFAGSDRTMRCSECEEAESAWAEKLAAAEERARRLEGTSDTLRCKLAMEEGRAERYRELIAGYLEWGAMTGSDRDLWESRFRAALAPPPEAEKRGEG